jgi:rhodanese-related sulfurtransferase
MAKWILMALAVAAVILAFRGLAPAQTGVSPTAAAAMIKEKKTLQLIDVRTAAEYAAGHLAQSKLIPLQELEARVGEIDKSKPTLLYCRSGHRSGQALKLLTEKGFPNATHIEGGINAWQAAGLPITK